MSNEPEVCTHALEDQYRAAVEQHLCPICLDDRLRLLQLQCSVDNKEDPLDRHLIARLRTEVRVLWRVIAVLSGGGREEG